MDAQGSNCLSFDVQNHVFAPYKTFASSEKPIWSE